MYHDIKTVIPKSEDGFFVDTNVWYWTTYVASKSFLARQPQDYQVDYYPTFIESALENNADLYYSPLTLIELANLIERSEWEIYKAYNSSDNITLKKFRGIPAERSAVLDEIKAAWSSIKSMATELVSDLNSQTSDDFIDTIEKYKIDGYDALYYQIMKHHDVKNIITDDKDFRLINDINFYSCYPSR
ncbi:PIN domain-containing protein [Vibrio cholerae]|nr:PIN domain-containing protein [Vibrio cholerae]